MLQQNGLFCAVMVVAILLLVGLALPATVSAQSDQFTRVKISSDDQGFGDVLLIRDGNEIVMYGLTGAVPALSEITLEDGVNPPMSRFASFTGKFPIRSELPARFSDTVETVTITATSPSGTITGTIDMTLGGEEAIDAIRAYKRGAARVLAGEINQVTEGVPPHALLDVIAENEADQPALGKVLLTQRLVGQGSSAVLVDQYEGLSDSGSTTTRIQTVPAFSQIGIFSEPVDVNNPDRTKRLQVIDTANFFDGDFVSNGAFIAFSVADMNSLTDSSTLFLRIVSQREDGPDGTPPRIFLGRIETDADAPISETPTVIPNNPPLDPDAPRDEGIAVVRGQTDPYAQVAAFAEEPPVDVLPNQNSENLLTSPVVADGNGNFEIVIPGFAPEGGVYEPRQQAYLQAWDQLGNVGEPVLVDLDDESFFAEAPVATQQPNGNFLIAGVAEPSSIISIVGLFSEDDTETFVTAGLAGPDGSFAIEATPFFEYEVTAIDQAGNATSVVISGDQGTVDPSNLAATVDFPNINISGTVESNANVLIYGFPLNQVPDQPQTFADRPAETFFVTQGKADQDGNFNIPVPASISQIILVQAVDSLGNPSNFVGFELVDEDGNPLNEAIVAIEITDVVNNLPNLPDTINGRLVNADNGTPIDGSSGTIQISAFRTFEPNVTDGFPFVNGLNTFREVGADGSFSLDIPEIDLTLATFVDEFYLVATERQGDGSLRILGFRSIEEDNTALDRRGPDIRLAPTENDVELIERERGVEDQIVVNRVFPAGTSGGGANALPDDAIPFIFVIADGNDDNQIDIHSKETEIIGFQQLYAASGIPRPGAPPINIGDNFWDPELQTIRGHSVVFVTLVDAFGNFSPNPIPVFLDVEIFAPNADLITASGDRVQGRADSVEASARVSIFKNENKTGLLGITQADELGQFFIGGLQIEQDVIYISTEDQAGNISDTVELQVTDPVTASQPIVMDGFGGLHSGENTLSSASLNSDSAVALAEVENNPSVFYMLLEDGTISALGSSIDAPIPTDQLNLTNPIAKDLEVVSEEPFSGYVLLGNGVIVPFGEVSFFGDLFTMQQGHDSQGRLRISGTQFFDDLDGNGVFDSEDTNGNGQLDIIVGIGGNVIVNEDTNGNGVLDTEPTLNVDKLDQGFGFDIARDLELVKANDGTVNGYVILDGFGVMWSFGEDINGEIVRPDVTNGIAGDDIFRDFELNVEDGQIVDFITLNGFGQVFGLPDGPLGAGSASDPDNAGHLSFNLGASFFGFDIARDIVSNPEDSNEDGVVDYNDGFYILNGLGTVSAIGDAEPIESLFLGFDIARDLEFGAAN